MSLYDLLPPNATTLERDFSRSISSLPKIQAGPPTIRTAKRRNIPARVLPWLVYEYGLGELSPYFSDLNDLIVEGVSWQRIRGTPDSIVQAIGWLGFNALLDECEAGSYRWSEYHVGLEAAVSDQSVLEVIHLAGLATPVRSRMSRIFAVYDLRRFVLDDSLLSEGAMLSDHSGIRPAWAAGTQISFGRVVDREIDVNPSVAAGLSRERHAVVVLLDRFILSHSIMGGTVDQEAWHTLNPPMSLDREHCASVMVSVAAGGWVGSWSATTWLSPVALVVGGRMPPI